MLAGVMFIRWLQVHATLTETNTVELPFVEHQPWPGERDSVGFADRALAKLRSTKCVLPIASSVVSVCLCDVRMSRRYDSRTTTFSPEGRLYQVEYAMEAISNAGSVIGVLAKDGIALVAEKKISSKVRDWIILCRM